jgi:hypothetical protein
MKTKKIGLAMIALLLMLTTACTHQKNVVKMGPCRAGDAWGYANKRGKVAIDLQYHETHGFSEGLALVKVSGKYGYIDKNGDYVIQPQFSRAHSFCEDVATAAVKGR